MTGWLSLELLEPAWLGLLFLLPLLVLGFQRSLVDFPRRQLLASLLVRSTIFVLLVLSLAGLNFLRASRTPFVVFAIDQSDSIGRAGRQFAVNYVREALEGLPENRCAVVPFADQPTSVVIGSQRIREWLDSTTIASTSDVAGEAAAENSGSNTSTRGGTNLEMALQTAVSIVPAGLVPQIVLLSDGNATGGDAISAAEVLNCAISTVELPASKEPELQVSAVRVPTQVAEGEPFRVEAVIDSNHDDRVIIDVYSGDFRVASEEHDVRTGENSYFFNQQIKQPTEFTVRIRRPEIQADKDSPEAFRDTVAENNTASGIVFTSGRPRVLLIDNAPDANRSLEWALKEEGIELDVRPAQGLPESPGDLQAYELVAMTNVAANELTSRQMEVLHSFVADFGGGFLMLGSEKSFGLGGFYRTKIEEVLPVRCDIEKEKEKPGLGMVLIIDKSGSMGGQKIELAKDAARAAVDLLGPKDQIGVIAFDGTPYWVSEVRSAADRTAVMDRIASIEAGGGTALYPAMDEAFRALLATTARLKHVIILTDGYSTPGDFDGLTTDLAAAKITVSTVGIGDADQAMLQKIAETGKGRYYFTDDPSSVPQIFARETIAASRSAIREEPFLPVLVRATSVMEGVDLNEAPFLLGFVVTQPKATSEIILTTESGEPLLSWWRYGLGMSAAFTSDARSRWAAEWLTWGGYNRFWAQLMRHCMKKQQADGMTVEIQKRGSHRRIVIDSVNSNGEFLNDVETELVLLNPELNSTPIPVQQTAPGRYEADLTTDLPGAWHVQLTQKQNGQTLSQQTRGLVVGYNDELRLRQPNTELLQALAELTAGAVQPTPRQATTLQDGRVRQTAVPLWPWLLTIACLLFVADVMLKRLELSKWFGTQQHRTEYRGNPSA